MSLRTNLVALALTTSSACAPREEVAPLETARSWLQAVAHEDTATLARLTALPLTFATADAVKPCDRTVTASGELAKWSECLRTRQARLLAELKLGEMIASDPPAESSRALEELAAIVPGGGSWIAAYINGDGVTFTFRLLVRNGAIAAFLVEAEFESG